MECQATRLRAQPPPPGAPLGPVCTVSLRTAIASNLPAYRRWRSFETSCDPTDRPAGRNPTGNLFALLKLQRRHSSATRRRSDPSIESHDPLRPGRAEAIAALQIAGRPHLPQTVIVGHLLFSSLKRRQRLKDCHNRLVGFHKVTMQGPLDMSDAGVLWGVVAYTGSLDNPTKFDGWYANRRDAESVQKYWGEKL